MIFNLGAKTSVVGTALHSTVRGGGRREGMTLLSNTPTTEKSGSTFIGQPYTPPQAWTAWLIPSIIVFNIGVFACSLYVDNCIGLRHACSVNCCVFPFLRRFAFEPLSVNPFFGPTIETLVFPFYFLIRAISPLICYTFFFYFSRVS